MGYIRRIDNEWSLGPRRRYDLKSGQEVFFSLDSGKSWTSGTVESNEYSARVRITRTYEPLSKVGSVAYMGSKTVLVRPSNELDLIDKMVSRERN